MESKEYWAARALQREEEAFLEGSRASAYMFHEYQVAAKQIQKEISSFYAKYAGEHGLTYEQAVRLLSRPELQEWKAALGDYVAMINAQTDPAVKAALTAQLDALSINSRLSRLEALQGQVDMILGNLYDRTVRQIKDEFGDVFIESYYKKSFDIQSRVGFFREIAKIDAGIIEDVTTYPWSGAMFSERLWRNTSALIFGSREIITQGLIEGKSVVTMSKALSDYMGKSYKAAERLIRTETNYFHNAADRRAYEANGVEWYEFMATLEVRTCEHCGSLDGQHFRLKDAVAGVNFPPIHPNCRCTTVEWDPEEADDWAASGVPMPERTTFKEWYDDQVAQNGQGSVETERKKAYNETADRGQYSGWADRLGKDAPSSFEDFQKLKYHDPEVYSEMKSFFAYKGRVPEATKEDFRLAQAIKATGIHGTVRVPPEKIDVSAFSFDLVHVMKKHTSTEEEARSYIENALFSIKRRLPQKDGSVQIAVNYYSEDGAAYVLRDEQLIRTAFTKDDYNEKTAKAVEVAKNGKK